LAKPDAGIYSSFTMPFEPLAFDEFAEGVLLFAALSLFAWLPAFAARSLEEKRPRRPGPFRGPWLPWYGAMACLALALHRELAGVLPDGILLPLILLAPMAADCLWKAFACPRLGIEWRDRSADFLNFKGIMSLRAALCWFGYILACLYVVEPALMDGLAGTPPRLKGFLAGIVLACVAIDAAAFIAGKLAARGRSTRP